MTQHIRAAVNQINLMLNSFPHLCKRLGLYGEQTNLMIQ